METLDLATMMSKDTSAHRKPGCLLGRLQNSCRVDPAPTAAAHDDVQPEIVTGNYAVLAETIGNIFNEFWQGNAFFLTFATLVLGSILANWTKFSTAPAAAILAIGGAYIFLLGIWLLTMVRHAFYIKLHMDHAMQLEQETPGLEVYTHRIQEAAKSRLPSTRKIWLSVPVLFALCMTGTEVSALTRVDQHPSSSAQRGTQVAPLAPTPSNGAASPPRRTIRTTPSAGAPSPAAPQEPPRTATSR